MKLDRSNLDLEWIFDQVPLYQWSFWEETFPKSRITQTLARFAYRLRLISSWFRAKCS